MRGRRRHWAGIVLAIVAVAGAWPAVRAAAIPEDRAAVEHALSRLSYGPRPGDVERVARMGLSAWIEQQLHPSRLDDAALQQRLTPVPERPQTMTSPMDARRYTRQAVEHLSATKLVRATYSERQLEEILVDFWFNHFNVFAGKGRTGTFLVEYETEAIRPHVWGRFRDLLGATAKSPAMLFYLDNWMSADPEAAARLAATRRQSQPNPNANARRRGLNENYARELLELHTLGVDGGYTQQDVIEVARAFTGWGITGNGAQARTARPAARAGGARRLAQQRDADANGFRFTALLHDQGEKVVLGQRLRAGGGIEDGERVLDILADHPSTARHIAHKLAQRFVSDAPPDSLVTRVAAKFRDTRGDLRETVREVITSPEFFANEARAAKVKTPLEFIVSMLRASGRELGNPRPLLRALQEMGMAPYRSEAPTGYADDGESWTSAGALVARMNVARQVTGSDGAAVYGGPDFQRR